MPASTDSSSAVSLRSIGVVTVLSLGQMLVLFALQIVVANHFGTSDERDAFLAANVIPLLVGGALSNTVGTVVVTLASGLVVSRGEAAAESLLSRLGLTLAAVTTLFALGVAALSDTLVRLFFAEFSASKARLTAELLQMLCWLIPLNTLTGFVFGVEHARRRFVGPALSGLLGPAATIVIFVGLSERTIEALAWSILLGSAVGVGMLLVRFPRPQRMNGGGDREMWSRFGRLAAPVMIGFAYAPLVVLVDRSLAAELTAGSISRMDYAWKIATAIISLGASGLSVIAFPSLAQHAARKDWELLQTDLDDCWRLLAVIMVPILGGIVVCGHPIITVVFQRGAFSASDSAAVSRLLVIYGGAILAASVGEIASRTFYSLGKMGVPTLVGMIGLTVGTLLKFVLVGTRGVEGLAAATSLTYLINTTTLLILLSLMGMMKANRRLVVTILRSVAASSVSIALAAAVISPESPTRVLIAVGMAVAAYVLILAVLGDEFARRALRLLRVRNEAGRITDRQ